MGTGVITGPYAITAGQTLSLNDPAKWSIASQTVQIQNNTGFTVSVQSSGAAYNIQPFTASTIPCAGGQTLVAQVSSTINVSGGFLTAVWLLPGQDAPMPDGPMVVYPKQTTILTASTYSGGTSGLTTVISGWTNNQTSITLNYAATYYLGTYIWLTGINLSGAGTVYPGVPYGLVYNSTNTPSSLTWTGLNLTNIVVLQISVGNASAPLNSFGNTYFTYYSSYSQ